MKKNKTIFVDKKGKKWSKENIQDLIDGYEHFKKFKELADYYF